MSWQDMIDLATSRPRCKRVGLSKAPAVVNLHPLDRLRLQRGVEHLHSLGPRATAELLAAVGEAVGGMPAILGLLAQYQGLSPELLRTVGGDQFPRKPIHQVQAA